jgi:hypothetical protein
VVIAACRMIAADRCGSMIGPRLDERLNQGDPDGCLPQRAMAW